MFPYGLSKNGPNIGSIFLATSESLTPHTGWAWATTTGVGPQGSLLSQPGSIDTRIEAANGGLEENAVFGSRLSTAISRE